MNAASTLIATVLIGAGALAWQQQSAVESLREESKKVSREVDSLRERRALLEDELSDRESAAQLRKSRQTATQSRISAAAFRTEEMEKQTAALEQEAGALETEYETLRKSMNTAVEQVRRAASEAPAVNIPVAGGQMLKQCRIRTIENGVISVEHSSGLHRLSMEETPAEWVENFALTWTLPGTTPAAASVQAISEAPHAAAPPAPGVPALASAESISAPAAPANPALEQEIRLKREAISSWLQRYSSAWNAAEHHSSQASIAALKHLRARYRGRISAHTAVMQDHLTNARKAQSAAQDSLIRIHKLRGELADLLSRRDSTRR